jgi:hypothetical protein
MNDSRYYFQPWHVKVYRWLRWKPQHACYALLEIAKWLTTGAKTFSHLAMPTRRDVVAFIWRSRMSTADIEMGRWKTIYEIMEDFKKSPK